MREYGSRERQRLLLCCVQCRAFEYSVLGTRNEKKRRGQQIRIRISQYYKINFISGLATPLLYWRIRRCNIRCNVTTLRLR